MITYQDKPAAPPPSAGEGKCGDLWPVCRPDMADPDAITARLAEDWHEQFEASAIVHEDALVRLGWPRATVRGYAERVRDAFVRLQAARFRLAHGGIDGRLMGRLDGGAA